MVLRPQQFDVIVCPNLYGNILSNIGAGLVGGPGLIPGCNIGRHIHCFIPREIAIFEPGARHVGMDIKDLNCANPASMLLSASWLLRHLGLSEHGEELEKSIFSVISEKKVILISHV